MWEKEHPGIQHLEEIKEIDKLIRKLKEKIIIENEKLTDTAVKYKEIQVQTSGATDKIGEKGPEIVDFQKEIEQYIKELNEKKIQTLAIMKQLPVKHQILILHYMNNKPWKEAAEEMKKSAKWVREEKRKALDGFCRLYDKQAVATSQQKGNAYEKEAEGS